MQKSDTLDVGSLIPNDKDSIWYKYLVAIYGMILVIVLFLLSIICLQQLQILDVVSTQTTLLEYQLNHLIVMMEDKDETDEDYYQYIDHLLTILSIGRWLFFKF